MTDCCFLAFVSLENVQPIDVIVQQAKRRRGVAPSIDRDRFVYGRGFVGH